MVIKSFKGKKVLVTGHTGFKGTWLSLWLVELGAQVVGYSLEPNSNPSLFKSIGLERDIKHYIGDIRNFEKLNKVIQDEKPEIIFHLAAQALVRESYKNPLLTYETNVMGTVNLLEAVRHCDSVRTVINVTTDKCYENKEWVYGYREIDPLGGYDPYSSSKAASELITASYRNAYFNPNDYGTKHHVALASARAGNVIGGGDWAEDRLIPDAIKALKLNQEINIRNPHATRPWQHVLEPISGYLSLASKLEEDPKAFSEAWNFGPRETAAISVEEVVSKILKLWGRGKYSVDAGEHPHETSYLKLDLSKTSQRLKFKPVLEIDEALQLTVQWYKNFYEVKTTSPREFTINQIREYHKKRFGMLSKAIDKLARTVGQVQTVS